jgi:hypothetical protein
MLADVTAALAAAHGRLGTAEAARVPANVLAEPRATIETAQNAVQEAGTALGREDYLAAQRALADQATHVRAATVQINKILAARPLRPARPARRRR